MKVTIIGTGYVGLVSGACFAEMGVEVTCVDADRAKIERLERGEISIYEPGLDDIVARGTASGRLRFSTSVADGVADAEAVFIAVGTPADEDGSADISHVLDVAREIGRTMTRPLLIVTKSTVPVGTSDKVRATVAEELTVRASRGEWCASGSEGPTSGDANTPDFDVASNPEFLKEGNAVEDFMHPDRVVVGVASEGAQKLMDRLYKPFMINSYRMIFTDIRSAEMIKYAANAMLATRISFMNDIANLCELVGADVNLVRRGIGSDPRIGSKFLYPGLGYGGSCFPKDVKALIHTAGEQGYRMEIMEAVENVNRRQKEVLAEKVFRVFGADSSGRVSETGTGARDLEQDLGGKAFERNLSGKVFAVWGLSFKPETDDIRESASLVIIKRLLAAGATVRAYDPAAMQSARKVLFPASGKAAPDNPKAHSEAESGTVVFCETIYEAVAGADALLLATEWMEFRMPDWDAVAAAMKGRTIFDGRNIYDRNELTNKGFTYYGIGIPVGVHAKP